MIFLRCLCAAGCNIEVKNSDNIRADITALKYGHNNIADLLDRLRATGHRDAFARQLVPTSKPALKLTFRVLGHCGVGKTSLVKSLNAGLFSSLFRRSSSLQSNKCERSTRVLHFSLRVVFVFSETFFSHKHTNRDGRNVQAEFTDVRVSGKLPVHQWSALPECTARVVTWVQFTNVYFQVDISNVGEVTVVEFSGQENYFSTYHQFLWPSPFTLTAILFNLEDSAAVQIQQACFWLNFVLARQYADLPTCR